MYQSEFLDLQGGAFPFRCYSERGGAVRGEDCDLPHGDQDDPQGLDMYE